MLLLSYKTPNDFPHIQKTYYSSSHGFKIILMTVILWPITVTQNLIILVIRTCLMGSYYFQLGLISTVIYRLLKLYCSIHVKAVLQRMWQLFTVINEANTNTVKVGKIPSFLSFKCDSHKSVFTKHCLFCYPLIHFLMCLNIRAEGSNVGKVNGGKINCSGINCHSTLMMFSFDTLIKCKTNERTKLFKDIDK